MTEQPTRSLIEQPGARDGPRGELWCADVCDTIVPFLGVTSKDCCQLCLVSHQWQQSVIHSPLWEHEFRSRFGDTMQKQLASRKTTTGDGFWRAECVLLRSVGPGFIQSRNPRALEPEPGLGWMQRAQATAASAGIAVLSMMPRGVVDFFGIPSSKRHVNLLLLGLGNSGKMSLLNYLSSTSAKVKDTKYGQRIVELDHYVLTLTVVDLDTRRGGRWHMHHDEELYKLRGGISGVIWMFDGAARDRFQESAHWLPECLTTHLVSDPRRSSTSADAERKLVAESIPWLFLINKMDSPCAIIGKPTTLSKDQEHLFFLQKEEVLSEVEASGIKQYRVQFTSVVHPQLSQLGDAIKWISVELGAPGNGK